MHLLTFVAKIHFSTTSILTVAKCRILGAGPKIASSFDETLNLARKSVSATEDRGTKDYKKREKLEEHQFRVAKRICSFNLCNVLLILFPKCGTLLFLLERLEYQEIWLLEHLEPDEFVRETKPRSSEAEILVHQLSLFVYSCLGFPTRIRAPLEESCRWLILEFHCSQRNNNCSDFALLFLPILPRGCHNVSNLN